MHLLEHFTTRDIVESTDIIHSFNIIVMIIVFVVIVIMHKGLGNAFDACST